MMLAMMWPAPITKEIIYVDCEVNIWYEENWGDMTMACNCTQANLCDNCICCISSIWLKVTTAVSNHERHATFSFCCDSTILFNFKWHGLHFFNSLESCHFPIMRGIVRATKPYASASKIYKYSYLMQNSQAFDFVIALHKIGAKNAHQFLLLIFYDGHRTGSVPIIN